MTDEPLDPPPAAAPWPGSASCGLFVFGFVVTALIGMGLAFWAAVTGNVVLVPVGFFAPILVYGIGSAIVFGPRIVRHMREASRNAPSPESVAAVAHGEGVELGTKVAAPWEDAAEVNPTVHDAGTTPGKVLAYRLAQVGMTPGCRFGCAVAVAIFWNAILSSFVIDAFNKWNRAGQIPWLDMLFLTPFVLVGLLMIGTAFFFGVRWFVSTLTGQVAVEVSAHPMLPGDVVRIHIAQTGTFRLVRVAVLLVCTEEATYIAGTSKSTAKKEVAKHPLVDPGANPDGDGLPLTTDSTIPTGLMHSFDAPNNKIKWVLRVTARVMGFSFSNDYGVTVNPR